MGLLKSTEDETRRCGINPNNPGIIAAEVRYNRNTLHTQSIAPGPFSSCRVLITGVSICLEHFCSRLVASMRISSRPLTPWTEDPSNQSQWRFEPLNLLTEWIESYRPGAFHPVHPGDTLGEGRYEVIAKLGYGANRRKSQPHRSAAGRISTSWTQWYASASCI